MTAARELAEWALSLKATDIPRPVKAAACRHLMDGFGCALAAVRTGAAPYAAVVAASLGGPEEATVIGGSDRVSAPAAALANGVAVHALDFDDTHNDALVHATSVVLPAAFAVGEQTGASGADVLAAAVAGYEAVVRLGAAVPHAFHARGFHATSVCGVFSAALIASTLMGLTAQETASALGIAGSAAAGSLEFLSTGSATKQLHPGLASMNGILAARLAGHGADGPESIFDGKAGLFATYAGVAVDPSVLTAGLGSRWETESIQIKPYPACQLSHASLDALDAVRAQIPDAAAVAEIAFDVPAESVPIVCEPAEAKQRPRTPYEAKFSLAFSAAALLVDGRLDIDSFAAGRLARPDVLALARLVSYAIVPSGGPPARAPGRVRVRMTDGRVVQGESAAAAHASVDEKFRANAGDRAGAGARILGLEDQPDLRGIVS